MRARRAQRSTSLSGMRYCLGFGGYPDETKLSYRGLNEICIWGGVCVIRIISESIESIETIKGTHLHCQRAMMYASLSSFIRTISHGHFG